MLGAIPVSFPAPFSSLQAVQVPTGCVSFSGGRCLGSGPILGLFLSFPAPFYLQHHLDTVIHPTEQLQLCFLCRKGSSILPSDPLFLRPCALRISLLGLKAMP